MNKPVLVVMAAGLGSRYGGLKQMEAVTPEGEIILDFAVYDAKEAGFEDIIFVIKPEMEKDFNELVLSKMNGKVNTKYVFQELNQLPEGYSLPEGRTKPWGTCHAVMACKDLIDGPFAVINADDYYGKDAFKKVYDYLCEVDNESDDYCMAGYYVENTLSDIGTVTRGICKADDAGFLTAIQETKNIGWKDDSHEGISYDDPEHGIHDIPKGTVVSMNFWGYTKSMMDDMVEYFPTFLDEAAQTDPLKKEFLLPTEVGRLLGENKIKVRILEASDRWFGVTYKEDLPGVKEAFAEMKAAGKYPKELWG